MKSPMNMAPNKMVSPAKKNIKNPSAKQKAAFDVNKDGNVTGAEMSSVFNMNSPAKMGSAYKMDKSAFKLKSAPVNMNTPGSVAKLAGVSPMKNKYLTAAKEAAKGSNLTTAIQRAKLSLKKSNEEEKKK